MKCKCSITTLRGSLLKGLSVGHWPTTHHVSHYVGGTAAAAPPPFRPGEPALPNLWEPSPSHPILVYIYIYIHTYIHLIIMYDTPHSGTMIYAVTLRNSSVSRYGKIACCVLCLYVWLLYFCVNCCVCRLSSITWSIVVKRCVLEQKLLLTAYRKSYMRHRLVPKWMTLTLV